MVRPLIILTTETGCFVEHFKFLDDCFSSGKGGQRKPEDSSRRCDDGEFPPHLFHTVTSKDLLLRHRETGSEAQIHRPSAVLRHQLPGTATGKT